MSEESQSPTESGFFWSSMTGSVVNIDHKEGLEERLAGDLPAMNEKAWAMVMSLFSDSPRI